MDSASFQLLVLNPGGRDPDQDFPDFAGAPHPGTHAPVNYHGYAACTGGAFLRSVAAVRARGGKNILLLLRSDLRESLQALRELQKDHCRVFLSFKESGLHQIAQTLQKKNHPTLLHTLCAEAGGALSSTPDTAVIYQTAGATNVTFLPTPYPVNDPRWDFSIPPDQRHGIFLGTREFAIPTRQHLAAVLAALRLSRQTGEPVTVMNPDGGPGQRQLTALASAVPGSQLEILHRRLPYPDYLRLLARHQIVFQLDASAVPGQVAGDALLCRIPCVGGNGTTERLAFPALSSHGRDPGEISALAENLLRDPAQYAASVETSQRLAQERLSFSAIATRLPAIFGA